MGVNNNTTAMIILPSRHRLMPGYNDISDDVLGSRVNKNFVDRQLFNGKLSKYVGVEEIRIKEQQAKVSKPTVEVGLPRTRVELASAKEPQISDWSQKLGVAKSTLDDMRLAISIHLFE